MEALPAESLQNHQDICTEAVLSVLLVIWDSGSLGSCSVGSV